VISLADRRKAPAAASGERQGTSKFADWHIGCAAALVWVLLSSVLALAADEVVRDDAAEPARIYTTREERREAGVEHRLTKWLTLSALAELEYLDERFRLFDTASRTRTDDFSKTLQLGVELAPWPWAKGELIYEYQSDESSNRGTLDEAIVVFETGDLAIELGKLNLPFGVYFSNFVSGPLLEFGETRGRALAFSYEPRDRLNLGAFLYKGQARKVGADSENLGFGFALEAKPLSFLTFGMSYLSDLADSEQRLLSDSDDRYETRVDAMSAYAVGGFDRFEVSAEFLGALGSFTELEADRDRPRAWNVELAFFPTRSFAAALRLEGSEELEGAPRRQAGLALTWRVTRNASLTLEYLQGRFKRGLAQDSEERDLNRVHRIGAQFTLAF